MRENRLNRHLSEIGVFLFEYEYIILIDQRYLIQAPPKTCNLDSHAQTVKTKKVLDCVSFYCYIILTYRPGFLSAANAVSPYVTQHSVPFFLTHYALLVTFDASRFTLFEFGLFCDILFVSIYIGGSNYLLAQRDFQSLRPL